VRNWLLYIVLLLPSLLRGQAGIKHYQSFAIDNKEVIWMQVYHLDTVSDASSHLFEHLKRKAWIKDLRLEEGEILGGLAGYRPDYKRYGGKFINTSVLVRNGRWSGSLRISFKDGKYRVILEDLSYVATQSATNSGKLSVEQHEVSGTLTDWALNNYRTSFKKGRLSNLDILHFSFKDSFTLTFNQLIDSDW
jgi:hypothetical protein